MRRVIVGIAICLGIAIYTVNARAQEGDKLGPGWLSLDSSVGVLDEKIAKGKGSIEEALGIGISGFLQTTYNWSSNNPGFGNDDDISLRTFHKDHNEVSFDFFNITLEKSEEDWGVGFKLVGGFGRTPELLREATYWGKAPQTEPSAELVQSYLTTTIPVGNGIQVQGGLFVTLLGTEIIPEPGAYNDNISRSYLFGFSIPFRHLGTLFSYQFNDMVSVSAGPVTGWDNPRDNNNQPSFLGGVTFTPTDSFSLVSSIVYGAEQDDHNGRQRLAWANVASYTPFDPLVITMEYTYGHEEKVTASLRDATWQGLSTIISYGWTDRFSTALRGEFFRDHDGARLGGDIPGNHMDVTVGEVTLTGTYKFTRMLLGRMEVRQDWADEEMFQKGNSRSDKNQTTLALQLIYTY